jgi:hypothetical protein
LRIKVASVDGRNPVDIKLVMPAVAQKQSDGVTPLLDGNGNSGDGAPSQTILQDGKAGAYVHLIQEFRTHSPKKHQLAGHPTGSKGEPSDQRGQARPSP